MEHGSSRTSCAGRYSDCEHNRPAVISKAQAAANLLAQAQQDEAWPEGKAFGQLTPAQQRAAGRRAGGQLEAELNQNADAIGRVLDEG